MDVADIKRQVGGSVKKWRLWRGLSQGLLAERARLHRTYIPDVERGARNLSLAGLDRLAHDLKVTLPTRFAKVSDLPMLVADPRRPNGSARLVDILLMEEDLRDVELTQRVFRKAGLRNDVHVVNDGAEALNFLFASGRHAARKDEPLPHIVMVDLHLPKVDGLEVLRRIKGDARTSATPVVVLTVSERDADFKASKELGIDAYTVKSVDFHRLSSVTPQLAFQWALLRRTERTVR